jgi:hypothetical protein
MDKLVTARKPLTAKIVSAWLLYAVLLGAGGFVLGAFGAWLYDVYYLWFLVVCVAGGIFIFAAILVFFLWARNKHYAADKKWI